MSNEEYTPTTEQVENAYVGFVRFMRNGYVGSEHEHKQEFKRWLDQEYEKAYQQGCRDTLGVL